MLTVSWTKDYQYINRNAKALYKNVKLRTKDNFFMKFIATLLYILSFHKFKKETFLESFATTIGNTIYFPKEWSTYQVNVVLAHEIQHIKQFHFASLYIHPILGIPLMLLSYIFLPIPYIGIGRFLLELDADKVAWRYYLLELDVDPQYIKNHAYRRANSLSSVSYFWALPKRLSHFIYKKEVEKFLEKNYKE